MTAKELINIDPELMGGTPVFRGTRVPVQHLLDHIEGNATVDEFLDGFPSVSKQQVITLLQLMNKTVTSGKLLELHEDIVG